ncbi:hypothetical protein AB3S75_028171 [Citrus x aurantiifolia]
MMTNRNFGEHEMNVAYDKFSIGEEDEDGHVFHSEDIATGNAGLTDFRFCLVGRFLTDKVINFQAMKNTMATLWRLGKGVFDLNRVIDSGPWTFDQHILILKRLRENEQPHRFPLFHTSFWIQVYNLPIGFLSEKVLINIGNNIGEFQSSDPNNPMGVWRNYMRIRVSIDIRKPLKRRLPLKKDGGDWFWVEFKYERLNTFCFICGLLRHSEKICPKLYDCDAADITRSYGPEMKAPTHRNAMSSGERWLRLELPKESVANSGNFNSSLNGTVVNEMNASKSGISNNTKFANNIGSDGRDSMENIMSLQALPVVQVTSSQRLDKGKEVVSFANGLDLTQVVERYG